MKIENHISESVKEAIKALYGQEVSEKMIQLQKTKATFEGHLTLVVFPFLKMSFISNSAKCPAFSRVREHLLFLSFQYSGQAMA